jgi:DNA-binding transcriptional LysR family regulator
MLDIQHLQTFVAVASAKNFTRAAVELGYAQSTVTFHVKALERELGALLFDRFRFARTIILTEVGRKVYESAVRMLALAEEIKSSVRAT